jgi:hypothetical protein
MLFLNCFAYLCQAYLRLFYNDLAPNVAICLGLFFCLTYSQMIFIFGLWSANHLPKTLPKIST